MWVEDMILMSECITEMIIVERLQPKKSTYYVFFLRSLMYLS